MATTKKQKRKNGAKPPADPRTQIARVVKVVRAALKPEQRRLVNADNVHEKVAELVKMGEQLAMARGAASALKGLGL